MNKTTSQKFVIYWSTELTMYYRFHKKVGR